MSVFDVLAEPHRRQILDLLLASERPVGELVALLGLSQPAVSKHLRILREAGLVDVQVDAQRRLYRVQPEPLRAVDEWLEPYRRMWAERLDALERHLEDMAESDGEERSMYGQLEQDANGRSRLRFTRTLHHPREKVWRAVTEPEHLAAWFPTTIEGERAAGAPLRFSFPEQISLPPIEGEMIAYEPQSLIEFRWGTDIVRLELTPVPEGTELTLIDVLDEHGKAARDGAGWHTCLDALGAHLDGEPDARRRMSDWHEVHAHYVESFGPEAATIGVPEGVQ
jgi:DNA-binding transcriptional ArsR family regulator/uncharacterized protein YndB with AHSA1/START domain